jgi:hypothetical protein
MNGAKDFNSARGLECHRRGISGRDRTEIELIAGSARIHIVSNVVVIQKEQSIVLLDRHFIRTEHRAFWRIVVSAAKATAEPERNAINIASLSPRILFLLFDD